MPAFHATATITARALGCPKDQCQQATYCEGECQLKKTGRRIHEDAGVMEPRTSDEMAAKFQAALARDDLVKAVALDIGLIVISGTGLSLHRVFAHELLEGIARVAVSTIERERGKGS